MALTPPVVVKIPYEDSLLRTDEKTRVVTISGTGFFQRHRGIRSHSAENSYWYRSYLCAIRVKEFKG
jgi:hypothetical protein